MQWWLLCKFILPASGDNAAYYAECASWTCLLTALPTGDRDRTIYLWDYLFDSASNTTTFKPNESAGRNPNNIYTFCRDSTYPLLSQFMRYRMRKTVLNSVAIGNIETGNVDSILAELRDLKLPSAILERVAQRFKGRPFAGLTADEQVQLAGKILALGFSDHDLPPE